MKSHANKPAADLLQLDVTSLLHGADGKITVRAEVLTALTGYDDAALRRMAARRLFPAPVKARYALDATLAGIIKDLRTRAEAEKTSALEKFSVPSMEACEARLGIPVSFLKTAKSQGCPAFRDTRVYPVELIRWIFTASADGARHDWGQINVELDAKLKQVKLDTELRALVKKSEAAEILQNFAAIVFGGYKRLRMEAPRDFEMRPRAFIKAAIEEKDSAIRAQAEREIQKLIEQNETAEVER